MNTLEIKKVFFTDEMLCVELVDKRVIMTPLSWYEVLNKADEKSKNTQLSHIKPSSFLV